MATTIPDVSVGAHTSGPWRVEADTYLVWGNCTMDDDGVVNRLGVPVAEAQLCRPWSLDSEPSSETAAANARLICAAPDMLAALKRIEANHTYSTAYGAINCRFCDRSMDHEGTFRDMHADDCEMRAVHAAVARAEGRTP